MSGSTRFPITLRQSVTATMNEKPLDSKNTGKTRRIWLERHLRFHTVYWFSFLNAAGLPLPQTVFAHGLWLDAQGRKMSKTLGNSISLEILHDNFPIDALRYF
jgi:methionyl-tRNA synthetase